MVLTSWLDLQNKAIMRLGGNPITANYPTDTSREAKLIYTYWDNALESVLADHEWKILIKWIFLGETTSTETPDIPSGATELTTDFLRRYYFPRPTQGAGAGQIAYEIMHIKELAPPQNFDFNLNRIYVDNPITAINTYARVLVRPLTVSEIVGDPLLVQAIDLRLSIYLARVFAGKDSSMLQWLFAEYQAVLNNARQRDNYQGEHIETTTWGDSTVSV